MDEVTEALETKVLVDMRENLGLDKDDESFDSEILMHVNASMQSLAQIGATRPMIVTKATIWNEIIQPELEPEENLGAPMVMLYLFIKTKLLFDPPSATTRTSMEESAKEMFWRLGVAYNEPGGGT